MRALIIEDDSKIAKLLEKYLIQNHDIEVVGTISSVEDGIKFFDGAPQLDVIFSDIEILDGLCFDLFKEVEIECPIIFCTAYNQYALDAFNNNGIFYIVKPFTEKSIADAIQKFNTLTRPKAKANDDLHELLKAVLAPKKSTILVEFRDKTLPVSIDTIAYFYLDNEVTYLYKQGKEYPFTKSLEDLEKTLDGQQFFRANRQFLINRNFILEIEQFFARKLVVKLTVPVRETIVVSKAKASEFLRWLEG